MPTDDIGSVATKPIVFVSFSGRNAARKELVARLLARLSEQPLRPWIYESAEEEIEPGQDIAAACLARLGLAQLAILVVSEEAFGSNVTTMEVEQALKLHDEKRLQLLCISQTATPLADWPSPYSALSRLKHGKLRNESEIEAVVMYACSLAKVDYFPEQSHPLYFPLALRVKMELKIASARDKGRATGSFKEAMRLARECETAYRYEKLSLALMWADRLVMLCESEFDLEDVYYPRIAAGVVALELGRQEKYLLATAEEHFLCASKRRPVDVDASQGLGLVSMQRGDAMAAFEHFVEASRLVTEGSDPELEHNIVLSALVADKEECRDVVKQRRGALAQGFMTTAPGARDRVRSLYLLASYAIGDIDSIETQRLLGGVQTIPEDISLRLVDVAAEWNSRSSLHAKRLALKIGESLLTLTESDRCVTPTEDFMRKLTHRVAWLCFDTCHLDRARELFRSLADHYPNGARHLVDLFVFSRFVGDQVDRDRSAKALLAMRARENSNPPVTQEEFDFYVGMVQWDEHELGAARESFRRSGGSREWYDLSLAWLPERSHSSDDSTHQ